MSAIGKFIPKSGAECRLYVIVCSFLMTQLTRGDMDVKYGEGMWDTNLSV
ncbi:hypothetical protein KAM350_35540 [Aeromonas caviae]|nr:hypothetical protein KAM350_35540 [Aeromonas caviae]